MMEFRHILPSLFVRDISFRDEQNHSDQQTLAKKQLNVAESFAQVVCLFSAFFYFYLGWEGNKKIINRIKKQKKWRFCC